MDHLIPDVAAVDRQPELLAIRQSLIGLDRSEIAGALAEAGLDEKTSRMRARQLFHWLYYRGASTFEDMTSISKDMRGWLPEKFTAERPEITSLQESTDGTRKWLVKFPDGQEVESVHIPEEDRGALCVSSQVGCTLTCSFCHTGTMKLVRNLTAGEIISQMLVARDTINEWPSPKGERMISNIVMMGMGEPLLNYDNVAKALKIIMDGEGISLSKRRITLSTSGVVPKIHQCGEELGVNLAISLHAVNNEVRDILVPINKRYPIKELLQACKEYPGSNNARRITFEYVMLDGINDSPADARELVRLLKDIPAKVNLIPFNPWPGSRYECSSNNAMHRFAKIVNDAGYSSPIRVPRGRDIMAACGQLKSASKKAPASVRRKESGAIASL
ncbi:23S rRNA (adenine(2503)-C(2))-methyltransferase RlmN [Sneathiella sp. HT1-7]|jgi:23S rRNA (adenine2503-C2)-methyltransferase|uniref:23S rRNA (adenine(2503)-C(2))-methyltransferase RlmN n=1 Tax=Sneathiella sp. HT1-7 TaxID=2887192 RepID=UPI001D14B09D|nr:23S rRNA (adenine(2503)-C(2))-methyltransferase RlmN [Sneathiella sp. HT1-7]MCC3303300.1 23S rRNA (adenine(2503)-C(2))-methyltransferase RlmN [Sneathiella sp. HT1-7]